MSKTTDTRSNQELKQQAQQHLVTNGYKYRLSTMSWQQNGNGVTAKQVINLLAFHLSASTNRLGPVMSAIIADEIEAAHYAGEEWVHAIEKHVLRERQGNYPTLRRMLRLIQREGTTAAMHEAHVVMLRQFMWQVKRNMLSLPVCNHVAPVFWSREQGSGKTRLVERIYGPIENFTRIMSVNDLGKPFSGPLLAQARVVVFDEFANAHKAEAAVLKTILTGAAFNERGIYTDVGFSGRNRLSCIGTSNLRPPHGFIDETGGRRFWPVHCNATRPTDTNDKGVGLGSICVSSLWASVSYDEESPYAMAPAPLQALMEQTQDVHVRTHTSLSQYCDEALERVPGQRVAFAPLRKQYVEWCKQNGLTPLSGGREVFAKCLEDLNISVVHPKNRWQIDGFVMRSDALILS